MPTMNHDPGQSDKYIVILFTQLALIFIDESAGEVINLLGRTSGDFLRLLEEEGSRILKAFHFY